MPIETPSAPSHTLVITSGYETSTWMCGVVNDKMIYVGKSYRQMSVDEAMDEAMERAGVWAGDIVRIFSGHYSFPLDDKPAFLKILLSLYSDHIDGGDEYTKRQVTAVVTVTKLLGHQWPELDTIMTSLNESAGHQDSESASEATGRWVVNAAYETGGRNFASVSPYPRRLFMGQTDASEWFADTRAEAIRGAAKLAGATGELGVMLYVDDYVANNIAWFPEMGKDVAIKAVLKAMANDENVIARNEIATLWAMGHQWPELDVIRKSLDTDYPGVVTESAEERWIVSSVLPADSQESRFTAFVSDFRNAGTSRRAGYEGNGNSIASAIDDAIRQGVGMASTVIGVYIHTDAGVSWFPSMGRELATSAILTSVSEGRVALPMNTIDIIRALGHDWPELEVIRKSLEADMKREIGETAEIPVTESATKTGEVILAMHPNSNLVPGVVDNWRVNIVVANVRTGSGWDEDPGPAAEAALSSSGVDPSAVTKIWCGMLRNSVTFDVRDKAKFLKKLLAAYTEMLDSNWAVVPFFAIYGVIDAARAIGIDWPELDMIETSVVYRNSNVTEAKAPLTAMLSIESMANGDAVMVAAVRHYTTLGQSKYRASLSDAIDEAVSVSGISRSSVTGLMSRVNGGLSVYPLDDKDSFMAILLRDYSAASSEDWDALPAIENVMDAAVLMGYDWPEFDVIRKSIQDELNEDRARHVNETKAPLTAMLSLDRNYYDGGGGLAKAAVMRNFANLGVSKYTESLSDAIDEAVSVSGISRSSIVAITTRVGHGELRVYNLRNKQAFLRILLGEYAAIEDDTFFSLPSLFDVMDAAVLLGYDWPEFDVIRKSLVSQFDESTVDESVAEKRYAVAVYRYEGQFRCSTARASQNGETTYDPNGPAANSDTPGGAFEEVMAQLPDRDSVGVLLAGQAWFPSMGKETAIRDILKTMSEFDWHVDLPESAVMTLRLMGHDWPELAVIEKSLKHGVNESAGDSGPYVWVYPIEDGRYCCNVYNIHNGAFSTSEHHAFSNTPARSIKNALKKAGYMGDARNVGVVIGKKFWKSSDGKDAMMHYILSLLLTDDRSAGGAKRRAITTIKVMRALGHDWPEFKVIEKSLVSSKPNVTENAAAATDHWSGTVPFLRLRQMSDDLGEFRCGVYGERDGFPIFAAGGSTPAEAVRRVLATAEYTGKIDRVGIAYRDGRLAGKEPMLRAMLSMLSKDRNVEASCAVELLRALGHRWPELDTIEHSLRASDGWRTHD